MALVGIVVRSLVLVPSWMTLAQVGAAMWLRTYVDSRVRFLGGNTAEERLPKRGSRAVENDRDLLVTAGNRVEARLPPPARRLRTGRAHRSSFLSPYESFWLGLDHRERDPVL